jgi:hypothetical protein
MTGDREKIAAAMRAAWESPAFQFSALLQRAPDGVADVKDARRLLPHIYMPDACKLVDSSLERCAKGMATLAAQFPPIKPNVLANGRAGSTFAVPEPLWPAWLQAFPQGGSASKPVSFPGFAAALTAFLQSHVLEFSRVFKFYELMTKDWLPFATHKFQKHTYGGKDPDHVEFRTAYSKVFNFPSRFLVMVNDIRKTATDLASRLRAEHADAATVSAAEQWILQAEALLADLNAFTAVMDGGVACLHDNEFPLPRVGMACAVHVRPALCQPPFEGLTPADLRVICPAVNVRVKEQWNAVSGGSRRGPVSSHRKASARRGAGRLDMHVRAAARGAAPGSYKARVSRRGTTRATTFTTTKTTTRTLKRSTEAAKRRKRTGHGSTVRTTTGLRK